MPGLGQEILPGAAPGPLPGVFISIEEAGAGAPSVVLGTVGMVFTSDWGPLTPQTLKSLSAVTALYGSGGNTELVREAFRGGAEKVVALRVGTGSGSAAAKNLNDAAAAPAVDLALKYFGNRSFKYTVVDSLDDPTGTRELRIYEVVAGSNVLRETIPFAKGAGEPNALVAAVAAASLNYLGTAVIHAAYANGATQTFTAVTTPTAFTAGTNPTADGTAYSTALDTIAGQPFNVLAIDSEDTTIQASAVTKIEVIESQGTRRMLVIGEPTSVALATRQAHAAAFNRWNVVYVGNGFVLSGTNVQGARAAARVAGMLAASDIDDSLTAAVVAGATDLVGGLGTDDLVDSQAAGMLTFGLNPFGEVEITDDVTTYVALTGGRGLLWQSIQNVAIMNRAMDDVALAWYGLKRAGGVKNNDNGRTAAIGAAQSPLDDLVRQDALDSAVVTLDPDHPPTGRTAWFRFEIEIAQTIEQFVAAMRFS